MPPSSFNSINEHPSVSLRLTIRTKSGSHKWAMFFFSPPPPFFLGGGGGGVLGRGNKQAMGCLGMRSFRGETDEIFISDNQHNPWAVFFLPLFRCQ